MVGHVHESSSANLAVPDEPEDRLIAALFEHEHVLLLVTHAPDFAWTEASAKESWAHREVLLETESLKEAQRVYRRLLNVARSMEPRICSWNRVRRVPPPRFGQKRYYVIALLDDA
jgi:hypothetical protein